MRGSVFDREFDKWMVKFSEATGYVLGEDFNSDWLIRIAFEQGMLAEARLQRKKRRKS